MDIGIRKRPLLFFTIFYILGIFICSNFSYSVTFSVIFCFFLLFLVFRKSLSEYKMSILVCLIFMILGSLLYIYTDRRVTGRFEKFNEEQVELTGTIEELEQEADRTSIKVRFSKLVVQKKEIKNGRVIIFASEKLKDKELMPGDRISTRGQLSLPKGVRNPGGFDYRRYLTSKRISATIFVSAGDIKVVNKGNPYSLRYSGFLLRNKIISTINRFISGQQAALLNGMLIGYTEGLDAQTSQQFRDAGLSHIMAVSGSNVAFIIAPLLFLLRKFGLSRRATSIVLIPVLILFIYITGFSASVARAVIMAIIVLTGKFLYRDTDTLTLIALSMLMLLIYNPFLVFDAGFQLSYGATLGIILFYKSVYQFMLKLKVPPSISVVVGVTIAAQIGVLPLSVYSFNRVSIISILSNLLVVPVTEAITIMGFLMVILGSFIGILGKILAASNILLLTFILETTRISAEVPYAAINLPTPNLLQITVFYCVTVYFLNVRLINRFLDSRKEILLSCIAVLFFIIPSLMPKPFTIYFLDVGQGDSAFIRTDTGKNILIDAGGYTSTKNRDKTIGKTVILPFLMDIGVKKLDMVILTHGHDDHMAGLKDVLDNVRVERLLKPKLFNQSNEMDKIIELALDKKAEIYEVEAGAQIRVDKNTSFEALFPHKDFSELKPTLNNTSLVLQLRHDGCSALFCGDMEKGAEEFLTKSGVSLKSDIIKLGHHGSSTSSSEDFIKAVSPSAAIISVGKNNFGHPSPSVINRMNNSGAKLYRTDESGAVIVTLRRNDVKIKRMVNINEH